MATHLKLERIFKGETYTIGKLYIDGKYFCDTIEDKVRKLITKADKIFGKTAIPDGVYKVVICYSKKFERDLPLLVDVPFFTGIRIHSGNTEEDSEGCIIVGENKIKGKVVNSRKTLDKLMKILEDKEDIVIEVGS